MKTLLLTAIISASLSCVEASAARVIARVGGCPTCAKAVVSAPVITEHVRVESVEVFESPVAYVTPLRVWQPVRQRAVSAVRQGWWGRMISRARTVRR